MKSRRLTVSLSLLLPVSAALLPAASDPTAYAELRFHAPPKPLPAGATTEDWPHFLGPHHDATTRETKLLDRWPTAGPKIVWEMATGEGYACPTFGGGRLVYFHRVEGKETVDCLDPETGRIDIAIYNGIRLSEADRCDR